MTSQNNNSGSDSCETCKYSVPIKSFFLKEVECRRYPPQLVMVGQEAMGVGSYKWKPAWPNVPLDSFCGEHASKYVYQKSISERVVQKYDVKKWNILKDIDSDISRAVNGVRVIDPSLEEELAERYMSLQDKSYLKDIFDTIVTKKNEEIRIRDEELKDIVSRSSEKILKQIDEFEKSLGANGFDETYNGTVASIEPYDGSWRGWLGGIIVKFVDGRVLIKNGVMSRLFQVNDNSWK